MKLIRVKNKFTLYSDGVYLVEFKHGKEYIVPDGFVDSMRANEPNVDKLLQVKDFLNQKALTGPVDYTGKQLLVTRTGGYGDMFFLTRSVLEIKKTFSDVKVTFACGHRYLDLLQMFPIFDKTMAIPIPVEEYERCDYFFTFEGYIETNPEACQVNAYELIARKFFITLPPDHHVPLTVPLRHLTDAETVIREWTRPVVAIQPRATAQLRTWPIEHLGRLVKRLDQMGYDVLLLDREDVANDYAKKIGIKVLTPWTNGVKGSFGLCVALIRKCVLVICPDSVFTYVGDSLEVKTIALYGPFSSELRAKNLDVYAIEMPDGCYNCCAHTPFPCSRSVDGWSPCLKSITPEMVLSLADIVLKEREGELPLTPAPIMVKTNSNVF